MFLCQILERQPDPKYRRDWRVVWYRVAWDASNKKLVWSRQSAGKWRCTLIRRDYADCSNSKVTPGKERAERDFLPRVLVVKKVSSFDTVTLSQMKRMTGINATAAKDFVIEGMDDEKVFLIPQKLPKEKPAKVAATDVEILTATATRCAERIAWFNRKIKRLETFRKKWERRAIRTSRKLACLTSQDAAHAEAGSTPVTSSAD